MARYSKIRDLVALIFIAVIYIGFRLVTQSGQTGVVFQNDGYAMSGGFLILAGGVALGWWYTKQKFFRKDKK